MSVASVAIQFTIIDMLSRGVDRIRGRMESLAKGNEEVMRSFDRMNRSAKLGAMSFVGTRQVARWMRPAVLGSASMQEAMLRVEGNLAGSAKNAQALLDKLRKVRSAAIDFSAPAPMSAEGVVDIENALLKAGVKLEDVAARGGAAFAATILSSLSGETPALIGESLANIGSQFDLKGQAYGDLADWLVRVDDASATSIPALVQGLRMSGTTAKALRIPVKDTVTSLGALSQLGERAGSSFNNMLIGMGKIPAFFKDGKFIGMGPAVALLKNTIGRIESDQVRLNKLTKLFGEEGARAAGGFIDAAKGFGEVEKDALAAASAMRKMAIWGKGYNASLAKLRGTGDTTISTMFDPLLSPMTAVANKTNEWVTALGKAADKSKAIRYGASGLAAGGLIGGALLAGGFGLKAVLNARKTLKGIGGVGKLFEGAGGAVAGIAAGKAVEAATGVQAVFVTNWPAGGMGGGGAPAPDATATKGLWATLGASGAAAMGRLRALAGAAMGAKSLGGIASAGAGTMAMSGAMLAGAGAAGYGAGSLVNHYLIDGTEVGEKIGEVLNRIWAAGGSEASRRAIEINMQIDENRRVTARTNDMGTVLRPKVRRGVFSSGYGGGS